MRFKTPVKAAVLLASMSLVAAGCSSGDSGGQVEDDGKVEIWTSMDQPVVDGLEEQMKTWADEAGIEVTWSKVDNINQLIITKAAANDLPDIAMIPQPGVVAELVNREVAIPLEDVLDVGSLESTMTPGALDAGKVDGTLYGLLGSMNVKSLVFYPKKAWEAAGYQAPTTLQELDALTEQIKGDGTAPWCLGIESAAATGWPATDWFEDLVMRYGGAQGYNDWVSHVIPFDSDLVRQAAAEFEKIAFTDGNVLGGRKSIASNNFGTAGNPMFDADPGCYMYKQGSFITGFFPDDIKANLDDEVGVFGFPPNEGGESPVLGGGDMAVLFVDDDSNRQAMNWLADPELGVIAAGDSSFISPHKTFSLDNYPLQLVKDYASVAYESSGLLFDGSDSMPAEVGSGSFWKEMTSWIAGEQDLDTTLQKIDDSWPSS